MRRVFIDGREVIETGGPGNATIFLDDWLKSKTFTPTPENTAPELWATEVFKGLEKCVELH